MTVMTGGRGSSSAVVFLVVVAGEQREQLDLLLAAGLDEQHLRAERLRDQLDHLVGERRGRRDHLARFEQEAHEVGRRAVQSGRELLDRRAARHDDLALRGPACRPARVAAPPVRALRGRDAASCAGAAAGRRDGRGRRSRRDRHPDHRRGRHRGPPPAATGCTGARATGAAGVTAGTAAATRTTGPPPRDRRSRHRRHHHGGHRRRRRRGAGRHRAARRRSGHAEAAAERGAGRRRDGLAALRDGRARRRGRVRRSGAAARRGGAVERAGAAAAAAGRSMSAPAGRRRARAPGSGGHRRTDDFGLGRTHAARAAASSARRGPRCGRPRAGRFDIGTAAAGPVERLGARVRARSRPVPASGVGLRNRLGLGLRLGLLLLQAPTVGQTTDAVGRGLVDARRVALHADLELVRELHRRRGCRRPAPVPARRPGSSSWPNPVRSCVFREPVSRAGA